MKELNICHICLISHMKELKPNKSSWFEGDLSRLTNILRPTSAAFAVTRGLTLEAALWLSTKFKH